MGLGGGPWVGWMGWLRVSSREAAQTDYPRACSESYTILQLHFGLGNSSSIQNIMIQWPSLDSLTNQAKITNFSGPIELNQSYKIVENIGK